MPVASNPACTDPSPGNVSTPWKTSASVSDLVVPLMVRSPTTSKVDGPVGEIAVDSGGGPLHLAALGLEDAVARLKSATDLPVAVGFGVRTPEQAAAIARVADGVVVGSAFIDIIAEHGDAAAPHVEAFTRTLADAIHGAKEIAA